MNEDKKQARKTYMRNWLEANRDRVREYRAATRDRRNARRRELYAQEPERRTKARQQVRQWQSANPDKRKAQRLKLHGLTLEQFQELLTKQQGQCAICGYSDLSDPNIFPLVDHCHQSGKVRGLLCLNCNQALGKFKDSPDLLRKALEYLMRSG